MPTTHRTLALALFLLLAGLSVDAAVAQDTRLGNNGDVYHLRAASLGEVLPDTSESVASDPVLALKITRSGSESELILVPGTDGPDVEQSWFLAHESVSDTVYVVWQRRSNIHSQILLASYTGGTWSPVIPVSDQRFSLKSSPRLAITRDSFLLPNVTASGDEATAPRVYQTTLHILWFEERGSGPAVVYAPVLLIDGEYVGAHNRFTLSELFPGEGQLTTSVLTSDLAPTIRRASDQRSVIAGFVNPETGRLISMRISTLSGELGYLSGDMRAHIIDVGARYDFGDDDEVARFAGDMRAHIIDVGARADEMDSRLVRFVGDEMRAHIIDVGARPDVQTPEDVRGVADEMRAHIIDVGFRLDERGLAPTRETHSVTAELAAGDDAPLVLDDRVAGFVRFQQVSDRDLPELDSTSNALLLSSDGESALIFWVEEDSLLYRETTDDGSWSEVHRLAITGDLSRASALSVLEDHFDAR